MLEALRGMRLLEELSSGTVTRADLDRLGVGAAGAWAALSDVYFGATPQRELQAAARVAGAGLSMDAVAVIEKHARKLLPGAAVNRWELRVELCGLRGSVAEIGAEAAARVRGYNRAVRDVEKKAFRSRALRGGKNTDPMGLRTVTLTLPERRMARLLAHLLPTANTLRAGDPRLSWEQAMADAAYRHCLGGAASGESAPEPPMVVMAVPDYAAVLREEGSETIFALTDGTTITGAELVAQSMATHGYVGLYDPVEGGVNLYRDQRLANWKQRILLSAEMLICPFPGCTTPASQCQVHHLTAWKHGGETNLRDLTIACRVHNARNDDDPEAPPRNGRLARGPDGVHLLPPDGGPPRFNKHPIRGLSARALLTGSP